MDIFEFKKLVRQAIDLPRLTMNDLAKLTGIGRDTLRSYRSGRRLPTPEKVRLLIGALREDAKLLTNVADKLDRFYGED